MVRRNLIKRARELRREDTEAEQLLWAHLRARRLGDLKFRRQVPWDDYILDFVCEEARLVVEVDGSQHYESDQEARDESRTSNLSKAGYLVLRFPNDEVLRRLQLVLDAILTSALTRRRWRHPLPKAGEGTRD